MAMGYKAELTLQPRPLDFKTVTLFLMYLPSRCIERMGGEKESTKR